ncbi:MAG: hypothetical protein U5J64_07855 [Halobacteriales archaeon]|nr:hypothetical protein [Halobacteriales archaeon]
MYIEYKEFRDDDDGVTRVVERVSSTEPNSKLSEENRVVEAEDLREIPNRSRKMRENPALSEQLFVDENGRPYAEYTLSVGDIAKPAPAFSDEFIQRYIRDGEEYWEEDSPLGKMLAAGAEINTFYEDDYSVGEDGDDPSLVFIRIMDGDESFVPFGWVHPERRGVMELVDHPIYKRAKKTTRVDDIKVGSTKLPEKVMSKAVTLMDKWASDNPEFGYSQEHNVIWVGERPDPIRTDWREFVSVEEIRRSYTDGNADSLDGEDGNSAGGSGEMRS